MSDDYEIPAGDTGIEPGTYLMTLTALRPFTLYETTKGWTREKPEDGSLVEAYNKIEWVFHTDDDQTGTGTTSTARSERSTLFAWATGLGLSPAVVLDRSKPIPAKELIGREAMVTFQLDKNGYSKITSVVPAPRARTAPAAAPAPRQEEPAFGSAGIQPAAIPPAAQPTQDDLPF